MLHLQLSQDTQGAGGLDALGVLVNGGVGDLAVVDDDGEAASSLLEVPADAAGELGILVGHEELFSHVSPVLNMAPFYTAGG